MGATAPVPNDPVPVGRVTTTGSFSVGAPVRTAVAR